MTHSDSSAHLSSPEPRTESRDGFRSYSPERRTALLLCGTGAHGAYHAGVLRALHEAGVKIDLIAGQGIGAGTAALAAIGGSSRLWEDAGIWRSTAAASLYSWNTTALALPPVLLGITGALFGTVVAVAAGWTLPWSWVAALGTACAAALVAAVVAVRRHAARGRRAAGKWWWRLLAAPVDATSARELFTTATWDLIRGAAVAPRPDAAALSRRYVDVLLDNLGQPGFAELIVVATDLDARHDIVAALLREPYRTDFLAPRPGRDRRVEVLDLAGVSRDHVLAIVGGALTPPIVADPALVTFAADSFWRGETHRLCDRVAALNRLLEEAAAAGATQAIVVSAVAPAPAAHMLRVPRLDPRSRLGEYQSAAETSALRDALEMARLRFDAVYVISPVHNPIGPFDLRGAYDESSDRRQDLTELMAGAYEDAYRQFIDPVVGASGEHLAHVEPGPDVMRPGTGGDRIFGA